MSVGELQLNLFYSKISWASKSVLGSNVKLGQLRAKSFRNKLSGLSINWPVRRISARELTKPYKKQPAEDKI